MISNVSRISYIGHAPLLDTVNLKIDPPDSRGTKYEPQRRFFPQRSDR